MLLHLTHLEAGPLLGALLLGVLIGLGVRAAVREVRARRSRR